MSFDAATALVSALKTRSKKELILNRYFKDINGEDG
jgi:hypothetical protein